MNAIFVNPPLSRLWALALVGLLCAASPALAQDDPGLDFTEGGEGGEGDGMDVTVDEAVSTIPTDGLVITGVVLRADPDTSLATTQAMSDVLMLELDKLEGYRNVPNPDLLAKFSGLGEQGAQDCLYNPICLSRLGKELGLERMVIGRLGGYSGQYTLSVDLINVEDGTVAEYVSRTVDGDEDELKAAILAIIPRLFGIRLGKGKGNKVEEGPKEIGPVQKTLAWSTAGLGVACIGLGVFFGLDASSIESDLESGPKVNNGGVAVLAITQAEAQKKVDEAQGSATLANIFYGVGLAAAGTSVLLFLIRPGSDIATEEELSGGFNITPLVGPDGAGVSAGFSW